MSTWTSEAPPRSAAGPAALAGRGEVFPVKEAGAGFTLYRIGEAVASRNIHAGIHDALRYGVRW
jgi:hypothetical protein